MIVSKRKLLTYLKQTRKKLSIKKILPRLTYKLIKFTLNINASPLKFSKNSKTPGNNESRLLNDTNISRRKKKITIKSNKVEFIYPEILREWWPLSLWLILCKLSAINGSYVVQIWIIKLWVSWLLRALKKSNYWNFHTKTKALTSCNFKNSECAIHATMWILTEISVFGTIKLI